VAAWVGEGFGLAVVRTGTRSVPRQRKAGVADGWPKLQWRWRGREPDANAWAPQHSTVAVKFDSKNKFPLRLKSNVSNELRISPNFSRFKRYLPML
jgi:hypothetical protein